MNKKLLFAMVACLLVSCHHQKKENNLDMDNPFFSKPETPYGVPAFDRLRPEHFIPAFEEGMRHLLQERLVDKLVARIPCDVAPYQLAVHPDGLALYLEL